MNDITVVIPTFNSADHVVRCLASVSRFLSAAEVLVVDNGSRDDTVHLIRKVFPTVTIIEGHGNVGFGAACNIGAQHATRPYMMCLNPDAELRFLDSTVLASILQRPPVGVVAAVILDYSGHMRPGIRRRYRHWVTDLWMDHIVRKMVSYRARFVFEATEERGFAFDGVGFCVSIAEFQALGGFDDRFFMYYEDVDLARRYLIAGYPIRVATGLVIHHVGGASAEIPLRHSLSVLGWLEYVAKWHGERSAIRAAYTARTAFRTLAWALGIAGSLTRCRAFKRKQQQFAGVLEQVAAFGLGQRGSTERRRYRVAADIASKIFT